MKRLFFKIAAASVISAALMLVGCDFNNDSDDWSAEPPFTVTFDSAGGTEVPAQHLRWREKPEKPEDPTKEGYVFIGWYEENSIDPYNFNYAIERDVRLTAKWTTRDTYDFIEQIRTAKKPENSIKAAGQFNGDSMLLVRKTLLERQKGTSSGSVPSVLFMLDFSETTGLDVLPRNAFYGTLDNISFSGCLNLKGIILPETLTRIESRAFYGCSNLESIEIPDSVTEIGESAFNCKSIGSAAKLSEVRIGKGTQIIGDSAFYGCGALVSVTISEGSALSKIGREAFYDCSALESISLPESMKEIGDYAFKNCDSLKEVAVPSEVNEIGKYAFSNCRELSSAVLSGAKIGDHVFSECPALKKISISRNVSAISDYAFYLCTKLEEVTVPGSVKRIGKYAFAGTDTSIMTFSKLTISEGVETVDEGAFSNCRGLETAVISGTVTTIGKNAFQDCVSLKEIEIPDSVTELGSGAFRRCVSLSYVTFSGKPKLTEFSEGLFFGCSFTDIIIPASVREIGISAFNSCENLGTLHIPANVWRIGRYAFRNCTGLTKVTIESAGHTWYQTSNSNYTGGSKAYLTVLTNEGLIKQLTEHSMYFYYVEI